MADYKSETYKGLKLTFTKLHKGFVGVQSLSRTSQYIGIGKGKEKAFNDAKKSVDKFKNI